jgi:hypothetical protein
MEQPPHFKHLTPEQVHAARTKTYQARADLSPPPRSKSALGVGKSPSLWAARASLKKLNQPEAEH